MVATANRCRVFTASTGTGTVTLGSAFSTKYFNATEAGLVNGTEYVWLIEKGNDIELVRGNYSSSGGTAARTTVIASKIGGVKGTTKINLDGTAVVSVVHAAEEILQKSNDLSDLASAVTAFNNIKQAASETATGVIELATAAEVATGTDAARAVTPAGLAAMLGWQRIASGTVSSAATLDLTGFDTSKYRNYRLTITNAVPATDGAFAELLVSRNGGSNYETTGYRWSYTQQAIGATPAGAGSASDSKISMSGAVGNSTNESVNIIIEIAAHGDAFATSLFFKTAQMNDSGSFSYIDGAGIYFNNDAVDALRFRFSTGNISSAKYAFEGQLL